MNKDFSFEGLLELYLTGGCLGLPEYFCQCFVWMVKPGQVKQTLSVLFTKHSEVFVFLQAPNLVFLAVSPEEKESWVNALNVAIIKAKNRILDEVWVACWMTSICSKP